MSVSISWVWDGDIDLKLSDPLNRYKAEGKAGTVTEIDDRLHDQAVTREAQPARQFAAC